MWVTFGGMCKDEVGWGRKIAGGDYEVLYSEGQLYEPEVWDKDCVREFPNLQSAIDYAVDLTGENTESMREQIEHNFSHHVRTNP